MTVRPSERSVLSWFWSRSRPPYPSCSLARRQLLQVQLVILQLLCKHSTSPLGFGLIFRPCLKSRSSLGMICSSVRRKEQCQRQINAIQGRPNLWTRDALQSSRASIIRASSDLNALACSCSSPFFSVSSPFSRKPPLPPPHPTPKPEC